MREPSFGQHRDVEPIDLRKYAFIGGMILLIAGAITLLVILSKSSKAPVPAQRGPAAILQFSYSSRGA